MKFDMKVHDFEVRRSKVKGRSSLNMRKIHIWFPIDNFSNEIKCEGTWCQLHVKPMFEKSLERNPKFLDPEADPRFDRSWPCWLWYRARYSLIVQTCYPHQLRRV